MTDFSEAIGLSSDILIPEHEELFKKYFEDLPESYEDYHRYQQFFTRLYGYKEKSFLLDPILPKWVSIILSHIKIPTNKENIDIDNKSLVALYNLSLLIDMCSYKNVTKYLPHEVIYLDKILCFIEILSTMDLRGFDKYERLAKSLVNRSLFAWLYIVAKNPFSLDRFDSIQSKETIANRILEVCSMNMCCDSICSKIINKIWSQLVTRVDQIETRMRKTIYFCLDKISMYFNDSYNINEINGYLGLLAGIFKEGPRVELSSIGVEVIDMLGTLMDLEIREDNSLTKVYITKLVQRIGLSFLKPRKIKWRYCRGYRSLENTLKCRENNETITNENKFDNDEDDEDNSLDCTDEQIEKLEAILATLLNGLRDPNSNVRNGAAKGLGRITSRLTKDFAEDIVNGIFEGCFKDYDTVSWHGGCLALAEMTYRGFLLPERLGDMVDILEKAIIWEEADGIIKQSEAVRDAATFISWAIARTYSPNLLKPYVQRLATHLVTVSLFDKELNIRRAASAAFQENVGRQGYFPSGIDIIHIIDYSSISRLSVCYNDLCIKVAKFEGYLIPMLNHLVDYKVGHQLMKMNERACEGLYHLVKLDVNYSKVVILDKLLKKCDTINCCLQYKILKSIESVVRSLLEENSFDITNKDISFTREKVLEMNKKLSKEADTTSRNKRSTFAKLSLCYFIKICCECGMPLSEEIYFKWLNLLENFTEENNIELRDAASIASKYLMKIISQISVEEIHKKIQEKYLYYIKVNKFDLTLNMAVLMISSLPNNFLTEDIANELITFIQDKTRLHLMDPRVYALDCLKERFINSELLKILSFTKIVDCLNFCINDFTCDPAKGDVARFIREKAIKTIICFLNQPIINNQISSDIVCNIIGNILIQVCGKNINLRKVAAQAIHDILIIEPQLPIKDIDVLKKIFILKDINICEGFVYANVFDVMSQLLDNNTYGCYIRYGLVMSSGYHNGCEKEKITKIIVDYLENSTVEKKLSIITELKNEILKKNISSRVIKSILDFLDTYMVECFEFLQEDLDSFKDICEIFKYCIFLINLKQKSLTSKSSTLKEYSGKVLSFTILCNEDSVIRKKSLKALCKLLEGTNEVACFEVAKKITEYLVIVDENIINEDEKETAINLLSNTVWDGNSSAIKTTIETLRNIFKIS
ncbi:HEAT repeat and Armadillo-like helical domain and Armadillo-type fold domain and HEAT, type 2 repeat and Tubulin-specific chaperone D, C-terminal domain-containing protein [Strongyloides ratti]|uniref:Tubulin-specific chaperone D n=1 Tax=Strongyloides ratti TaxID=34506 RepID=A0A090L419_STRRB|nr:HEAT repeat and Armadillo-like helical domain and Armadillo-type fold domain and HEAT, type 2 repeat and Tubulin-specific chaperone D, C-terminal domain-containing protein [Strongyloides ratti]CEF64561.1 HEAT repeat and Armadillo-like helical domain and Armadillo-type fold domain and HEAT, type 2 repeat and Tubulin-specific chaperone D, C-terminal domain-containing protein [Strongyloides ratti]